MNFTDTALLICDLQNDFLHKDGAYARAGLGTERMAAMPARILPLAGMLRERGGHSIATQFTLVPDRNGRPLISPHLKTLRPFLKGGDFAPGSWGQQTIDELRPVDFAVEKIAYSAFYMTRLEWVLRKEGIEKLYVAGLVTNGGVASTLRDAHVRDLETVLLSDGCAAFSPALHETAVAALRPVTPVMTIAEAIAELGAP